MTATLDHRGWTAGQWVAPCVMCHQPAILRSPRGKPCYWSCAVAWLSEHKGQDAGSHQRAA
jgi:hypothetical protein